MKSHLVRGKQQTKRLKAMTAVSNSFTERLFTGRKKQKVENKRVRHVWIATKFKNEATIWNK